jgi:hypothetical protein
MYQDSSNKINWHWHPLLYFCLLAISQFSSHPGIVAEQSNMCLQEGANYWTNVVVRATYFEYLGIIHIQLSVIPNRKLGTVFALHAKKVFE